MRPVPARAPARHFKVARALKIQQFGRRRSQYHLQSPCGRGVGMEALQVLRRPVVSRGSVCVSSALAVYLLGTGSAFAIPSPELVVGSFTSISQLFALGSALLGGGATVATLRMRSQGAQTRSIFA